MITVVIGEIKKVEVDFNLETGSVDVTIPTVTIDDERGPVGQTGSYFDPIRLRMSMADWHDFGSIWLAGLTKYAELRKLHAVS